MADTVVETTTNSMKNILDVTRADLFPHIRKLRDLIQDKKHENDGK